MSSMLIFGGSGGIGSAIAKMAKRLGYSVVIADKREPSGLEDVRFIATDATVETDVKAAISFTTEKLGVIDVIVNCQGIYLIDKIENTTIQTFDDIINVNLKSIFLVCKNAIPIMKWQNRGYIVNIASMSGLRAKAGQSAYCASKFAVVGLTESLYHELEGTGVRITAICPSSVDTPQLMSQVSLTKDELDKILQPEDVARVVAELITSNKRVHRTVVPIEIEFYINKLDKKR